ncbi:MAG: putative bifunctional diguanylate cyclase/phosphodiesterase [Acidobacteriota bacterium]
MEPINSSHEELTRQAARIAGLRSFDTPTLEAVERRRLQLWLLTLSLLVVVALALVLITLWREQGPAVWLTPRRLQTGLLGLVVLFSAYAIEKELQLRRLTKLLVDERVLTAALTNRVHELGTILAAAKAMNLVLDLQEVLDTIVTSALELLDGHDGSIMLARGDELRTVAASGASQARGATTRVGQGVAGRVATSREPLLITGILTGAAKSSPYEPAEGAVRPVSSMSVPLTHRDELLGVLNINARPDRVYNEYDLRALGLFGEHAAGAIANAQLHEEQKLLASQSLYQAMHDTLTNLPNRGLFLDRVEHSLSRRRAGGHLIALLFLDLDDFKIVNDSFGHAAGDEVLVAFSQRLRGALRTGDTVARFGGDEFAVLVEDVGSLADARLAAERVAAALQDPFPVAGQQVRIQASIGVAVESIAGNTAEDLVRNADTAEHAAKEAGKGQIVVFEPSMHAAALGRLDLEADLRRGFQAEEFLVYYQPVFTLADRQLSGLEGLVRWRHPERGVLPASAFVPAAEQAGLQGSIDQWVLRQACVTSLTLSGGPESQPLPVSVNISPAYLRDAGIVGEVRSVLQETAFPADRLTLEITEPALAHEPDRIVAKLSDLKSLGLRIALDDFGSSASSLSNLTRFPVDAVKIDRVFVDGLTKEGGTRPLVEAIIRIARSLSLDVIAEGVEHPAQRDVLLRLGCRFGQGYFLCQPLPTEHLFTFVRGRE